MGIGSKLKDRIRKIMPNELAEFSEKAAPFVAPFNPVIAAAMAAQGSFDRTGSIGDSVKRGIGTYITGQALRGIGGAGFQQGIGGTSAGGIGSYFTSPFTGQATFGPERGSFFRGEGSIFGDLPTDAGTQATVTDAGTEAAGIPAAGPDLPPDMQQALPTNTPSSLPNAQTIEKTNPGFFKKFGDAKGIVEKSKVVGEFMSDPKNKFIVSALGGTVSAVLQYLENKSAEKQRSDFALFRDRPTDFYNLQYRGGQQAKDGGIIGLANGGEPAMEMDYRGGGFIPVGAKERADDVPARLSKNEFVMTADAVRAAGGGSVDVGAQRMYDLMNRLEAQA